MSDTPKITIDNIEYPLDKLSDNAKSQLTNLQLVDQKIASIQQELAMMQTARMAYASALQSELPTN
jgi:hypothetical protein